MATQTAAEKSVQKKMNITFKDMPGFDISSASLISIIDPCCQIVKKSGSLFQAFEMITLQLTGNELSGVSVDMDSAQVSSCGTVPESFGDMRVAVPALQLFSLLKNNKSDETVRIRYDKDENKLVVKIIKSTYKLPVFSDPIPLLEDDSLKANFSLSFPVDMFLDNLQRIIYSAARNDVRFYMNGIYLNISHNLFCMVATDGHRLATTKNPLYFDSIPEGKQPGPVSDVNLDKQTAGEIMPIAICPVIQKVLKGRKGAFTLDFCNNKIIFNVETIRLVVNVLDATYPRWEQITKGIKNTTRSYTVGVTELRDSLSRAVSLISAGSVTREFMAQGVVTFKDEEMVISSPARNKIDCEEILSITRNAGEGDCVVGINCFYLLDAINAAVDKHSEDKTVTIRLTDPTSALFIDGLDELDVIMPVRV